MCLNDRSCDWDDDKGTCKNNCNKYNTENNMPGCKAPCVPHQVQGSLSDLLHV